MANFKFGVTGKDRKALVTAISELLNTESQYLGIQKAYAYQIGEELIVDKDGMVTGELSTDILEELAERGFQAEIETVEDDAATEAETETEDPENTGATEAPEEISMSAPEEDAMTETETHEMDAATFIKETHEMATTIETEENAPETHTDRVCIEIPLTGFTPENIDILCRMVTSKEHLIKMALGVNALPIRILDDRITFDWFDAADNDTILAHTQFISALCVAAKKKKRVTAKPDADHSNPRFGMRVFMNSLGLIGHEYSYARKLYCKNLPGSSAWRFYQNEKPIEEAIPTPEIAVEATDLPDTAADITLADEVSPEYESDNVADISIEQ